MEKVIAAKNNFVKQYWTAESGIRSVGIGKNGDDHVIRVGVDSKVVPLEVYVGLGKFKRLANTEVSFPEEYEGFEVVFYECGEIVAF